MKSSVCAIIVTYNIGKNLLKCFNSIENQVDEVVIVDNGSNNETSNVLKDLEKNPDVKVIYNKDNLGIATAQNIGVKYALSKCYKFVLTLDHDSEATPNMVQKLLSTYNNLTNQNIKVAIVGANIYDKNAKRYLTGKFFGDNSEVREAKTHISSGSLINTSTFEEVGFFNESLFLYYVDDDFCLRCRAKDWKIYICRSAILLHQEGSKEIKNFLGMKLTYDNYSFYARYYISRNAIYMLKNYFKDYKYCLSIGKRLFMDLIKILLFDKTKQKMIYYYTKGIFDGIIGKYGKLN